MADPQNPWDSRYGQDGFYYGTEPNDFLVEQASRILPGGRVLCLAEARGVQIETCLADLSGFAFDRNAFDAVVSIWCHLPPPLRSEVHARSVEALKEGGVLILEAYRPKQLEYKTGGPPVPELMMNREILAHDFSGLEHLVLEEKDRIIHEGQGHEGLSAVVQFSGVKRT